MIGFKLTTRPILLGFLSYNYIPNINTIRAIGDGSVLIMQYFNSDSSEATITPSLLCY